MTCARTIPQLLEEFSRCPVSAGRALGECLARDRQAFFQAAVEELKSGVRTPGHAHLLNLLIDNDLLPEALADRARFRLEEAVEFFQQMARMDPLLDVKLARWLLAQLRERPGRHDVGAALRILGILEQTAEIARLRPMLVQLLRVPEPAIRSKVALLLGRSTQDVRWALSDPDPRVRANATEALWGANVKDARQTLWGMTRDPHHRVVGNALLGLYKMGETAAAEELAAMARHASPKFRAAAAWAMGQTLDGVFTESLRQLESDPDEDVRRNARQALARLSPPAPAGTAPQQAPKAA